MQRLFDDEAGVVTRHEAVHLGIATQTDRGLYVPVVKHVEAMDIWSAAAEMGRVTQATRDGKAGVDEPRVRHSPSQVLVEWVV